MNKVMFSHKSDYWETPTEFYQELIALNYFDPCPKNPKFNGLKIEWKEKNYVNPPYSQIEKWVDKAIKEHEKGKVIWMLLPSRTDTKWFRKLLKHGATIGFIKGRLKFKDATNSAPFPSILAILDDYKNIRSYFFIENKDIND